MRRDAGTAAALLTIHKRTEEDAMLVRAASTVAAVIERAGAGYEREVRLPPLFCSLLASGSELLFRQKVEFWSERPSAHCSLSERVQ